MLLKRKNTLENLKKKLSEGVYIKSSGTTGESKTIFRTPENLRHCNKSAIDSQKIYEELNWKPKESFSAGIKNTIKWYINNESWWRDIQKSNYNQKRLGVIT